MCDVAAGIQSAVAAVSPGGFPMLLQRPGSITPEMIAMEQQRRATAQMPQHVTSLATHVRASVTALKLIILCGHANLNTKGVFDYSIRIWIHIESLFRFSEKVYWNNESGFRFGETCLQLKRPLIY